MLGIIGAMKAEVEQLKQEMKQPEVVTVAGMEFYKGTIGEKEVVVVQSGIGKVSAALCVQILADRFGVDGVVNTGIGRFPESRDQHWRSGAFHGCNPA